MMSDCSIAMNDALLSVFQLYHKVDFSVQIVGTHTIVVPKTGVDAKLSLSSWHDFG